MTTSLKLTKKEVNLVFAVAGAVVIIGALIGGIITGETARFVVAGVLGSAFCLSLALITNILTKPIPEENESNT